MGRDFATVQIAQQEVGGVLSGGAGLTFMPNKRGNPNWGRPMLPSSVLCTEFEMQVRQLHLMPETYTSSAELRTWCERNRNNFYIPEWLLDEWEIRVNSDFTGAA
jgi:hypothetical protein